MTRRIAGPCGLLIDDLKAEPRSPRSPTFQKRPAVIRSGLAAKSFPRGIIGYDKEDVAVDANGDLRPHLLPKDEALFHGTHWTHAKIYRAETHPATRNGALSPRKARRRHEPR